MIPLHIQLLDAWAWNNRGIDISSDGSPSSVDIDLNDNQRYVLKTWKRGTNEYKNGLYANTDEVFTVDIIGNNYQTVQTNLRKLKTIEAISNDRAHRNIAPYNLYILPSGYTSIYTDGSYAPPNESFYARVYRVKVQLPDNEYLFSEYKAILGVELTITRGPYIVVTSVSTNSISNATPLLLTGTVFPTAGSENAAAYQPSYYRSTLAPVSNGWQNTLTPSGILLFNDARTSLINAAGGTGFTTVTNTTALNTNVIRKTTDFFSGQVVNYPYNSAGFSVSSLNAYKVSVYGTVLASGAAFRVRSFLDVGNSDIYYSEPVTIQATTGPQAVYLGSISASYRFDSQASLSIEATNIATTSGNLYIDALVLAEDYGNLRAIYLYPQTTSGISRLDAGLALYSSPALSTEGTNLDGQDFTLRFATSSPYSNFPNPRYYGHPLTVTESSARYVCALFTKGNDWSYTTSGGATKTLSLSSNLFPTYGYMPRL